MKKLYILIATLFILNGCMKLDLNPLSSGSSGNWYSDETEIQMSINDLFKLVFWSQDNDLWTDDLSFRGENNSMTGGTLNAENSTVETYWVNAYKAINRANKIIEALKGDNSSLSLSDNIRNRYIAICMFVRASQYSRLIAHFGNVPYYANSLDLEEAFDMKRANKDSILKLIYSDYDFAINKLPSKYASSEVTYCTKGAAMAMKARIALYMGDFSTAKEAAKSCMELDEQYELDPDFSHLFLSSTKINNEFIFYLPRSVQLGVTEGHEKYYISRLAGGFGSYVPTFSLLSSFLCTDGLPIDESTNYNPRMPFENRDPRLNASIVKPGSDWLGFRFQPHPDSLKVLNLTTGKLVKNNDSKANSLYAPFTGLLRRKGIDQDYSDDYQSDPNLVIVRYADVLLMYAEARIEMNDIDPSVNKAINMVRARAYKVDVSETSKYPAVTRSDQKSLRKEIRFERRMEFAFEGLRYMDLLRWKIAGKALGHPSYGLLDAEDERTKVVNKGLWFFPGIPSIDENALADFSDIYSQGLIKAYSLYSFDPDKNYLWPIPAKELETNPKLAPNNTGY